MLLCRKSIGGLTSSKFNDIAMIGHNPFTGKTCFFQNALYSKTDGAHVPHPADKEKSETLWSGVHGGLGSGIECAHCHDADPFIHSPWIDGANDAQGKPIVPKMGVDPDFALGYNDTPYAIVNLHGQDWTMEKQLVSARGGGVHQVPSHRLGPLGAGLGRRGSTAPTRRGRASRPTRSRRSTSCTGCRPICTTEGLTEANWADVEVSRRRSTSSRACGSNQSCVPMARIADGAVATSGDHADDGAGGEEGGPAEARGERARRRGGERGRRGRRRRRAARTAWRRSGGCTGRG